MSRRNRMREAMLRDEPHCRLCDRAGAAVAAVTIAPIVAIDQGGRRCRANFQPVCARHAEPPQRAAVLARIIARRIRQAERQARMEKP